MTMRIFCILMMCGLTACATKAPRQSAPESGGSPPDVVAAHATDSVIVTRYELGSYRYPRSPSGRETMAVYRRTRVPPMVAAAHDGAATEPGREYVPASFAPLPPSAELAAELAAQKRITEELQGIRETIVAMEQQARSQYAALVRRTEETTKVRDQLEAHVARVRELEAQLRERLQDPAEPATAEAPAATPATPDEVKW